MLARLRVVEGDPAFEVLVPFAVDGGPTVLVDRGYVKPEQGSRVPPIAPPPTGTGDHHRAAARLRARRRRARSRSARTARSRCTRSTPHRSPTLTGVPLAGSYLQLVEDQPGGLGRDRAAAPGRRTVPVLRHPVDRVRHPRADRVGLLRGLGDPGAPTGEGRRSESRPPTAPLTTEEKLADRYGKRR